MATLGDRDADGTILPCPSPPSGSVAGRTMQESMYSPRPATPRLPDDAPNILIILIDDGGWCCTPVQTAHIRLGGMMRLVLHTPVGR